MTAAGDRRRRIATSINSLPHGRSWKFQTQVLEGVTIQLSSGILGCLRIRKRSAFLSSGGSWCTLPDRENPPRRLGFPEARGPLMGRLDQIPRDRSSGGERPAEHWKTAEIGRAHV